MDDPEGKETEKQAEERVTDPLSRPEVEIGTTLRAHEAGGSEGPHNRRNGNRSPPRNFLFRVSVNEWLTFGLAALSLFISYLTYRNAADTSDIKSAIGNLSELATQTKRQADATNDQLTEMRDEQRPWLQVVPKLQEATLINDGGSFSMNTSFDIKNVGHTPAVGIKAIARIVQILKVEVTPMADILRNVCTSNVDNSVWTLFDPDAGYDIVFPNEPDTINAVAVNAEDSQETEKSKKILKPQWNSTLFGVPNNDKSIYIDGGSIFLVFCVAYKAIGETASHHTGGNVSIIVPTGTEWLKNGQSVAVKWQRPSSSWHNFAD